MIDLEIKSIRKRRGASEVLRGLDLSITKGSLVAILGPSGCGKTTLLRLLAGFDRCDAGTIRLDDALVDGPGRHIPPERRHIGYVPQEGLLFPHLSVSGNIGFGLRRAERRDGRIAEVLRLVGLDDVENILRRQPHQLSGGQQQRVALARALAPRPRLVILDEPFNGLDGALRRSIAADTATVLRRTGTTAVLVTHDPQEAFAVADRIAVMWNGTLAQEAEPEALYRQPVTLEVARLTGPTVELSGEVRAGVADTPLGTVPVIIPEARWNGGRATILLRPEQVHVVEEGQGRRAKIRSKVFVGSHTHMTACLDGASIGLRLQGSMMCGDQVWLAVEGSGLAFPV